MVQTIVLQGLLCQVKKEPFIFFFFEIVLFVQTVEAKLCVKLLGDLFCEF